MHNTQVLLDNTKIIWLEATMIFTRIVFLKTIIFSAWHSFFNHLQLFGGNGKNIADVHCTFLLPFWFFPEIIRCFLVTGPPVRENKHKHFNSTLNRRRKTCSLAEVIRACKQSNTSLFVFEGFVIFFLQESGFGPCTK